jgi:hypothetical protein
MNAGSKKIIKKMGFHSDQEGIMRRFLRETDNWNEHLRKTKEFILQRLKKMDYQSVAFLGSGWLLDVPLDELHSAFKKIYLYDIRHPRHINHKTAKYDNVNLRTEDLTGGLVERLYKLYKKNPREELHLHLLDEIKQAKIPQIEGEILVSLNMMDQLDGLLVDFFKSRLRQPDDFWIQIRKHIQHNHLKLLKKHRSLLITDTEEIIYSNSEKTVNPLIHVKLPQARYQEKWKWTFDTTGSYYKHKKTTFNVIALEL